MSSTADQLRFISLRCKQMGERENMNAVRRSIRVAAKPLVDATSQAADESLPHGGGLNKVIAGSRTRISTLGGVRSAGVRITRFGIDTKATDQYGYARHPVYGNRKVWRNTQTPAAVGWFTKTLIRKAPAVSAAIAKQVQALASTMGAK